MTRNEYRAKCIEAMAKATASPNAWEAYSPELRAAQIKEMTAAFDALPSAGARVNPIEATEEMLIAAYEEEQRAGMTPGSALILWRLMSARGDLTNPPEGKP